MDFSRQLSVRSMDTVSRCTVISSSDTAEPTHFGPGEMAGAYVAVVGVFPPGEPAPPLHLHPGTDEAFDLAEGEATFLLGDREVLASGGDLVFVPRGTPHTVWNSGAIPVHGLVVISPGDAEDSFVPIDAA